MALIGDAAPTRLTPRLASVLCGGLGLAQLAAYAEMLRRYTVGATGTLNYFHSRWEPSWGALPLTICAAVLLILLRAFIRVLISVESASGTAGDELGPLRLE